MMDIPNKLPNKKGVVRRGFSMDLVPYMVEYVNHVRDILKRAKSVPKPDKTNPQITPSAPITPDHFFRNQISIRPVRKSDRTND